MNIIHLCPNLAWDDDARLTLELCRHHRLHGCNVDVFVRRLNPVGDNFHEEQFAVRKMRMGGMFSFMSTMRLARHIDGLPSPVVVHCHSFQSAIMALDARRLLKRPKEVKIVMNQIDEDYSDARRRVAAEVDRVITPELMNSPERVYARLFDEAQY